MIKNKRIDIKNLLIDIFIRNPVKYLQYTFSSI